MIIYLEEFNRIQINHQPVHQPGRAVKTIKHCNMKNFLFSLAILFTGSLHAQLKDSYVKGSIELQNGQRLNGYIKDDEMAKMNFKVSFKGKREDKTIRMYDTSDIKRYQLDDGEAFELLHIRGEYMTHDISVLGKLIVRGKASLYKVNYKSDIIYIVTKDDNSYVLQNDKRDNSQMSTDVTYYYFKARLYEAVASSDVSKEKVENISFIEKEFIGVIKQYNNFYKSENEILVIRKKPVRFIIVNAGGMYKNSNRKEYFFQGIFRTYFPKISRGASLNTGISYFNYKNVIRRGQWPWNEVIDKTYSLITVPFQLQQNFLNKKIRPYAFVGANISYIKITDQSGSSQIDNGLQNNFGVALLYGAGIEADIYKGIMLKTEYRDENFAHLVLVGIGYNFSMH